MSIIHRLVCFFGNSRITDRRPSSQHVILKWQDRHGPGISYATCRDISSDGMGIECCDPIPPKTKVVACIEDHAIPASIRYRKVYGGTYRLGLEFIDTSRPKRKR